MFDQLSQEEQLLDLEKQLSCPEGDNGRLIAKEMNRSNWHITHNCVNALNLQDQVIVLLEIGHGGCGHLPFVQEGFKLFNDRKVKELIEGVELKYRKIVNQSDRTTSKSGEVLDRHYSVMLFEKK